MRVYRRDVARRHHQRKRDCQDIDHSATSRRPHRGSSSSIRWEPHWTPALSAPQVVIRSRAGFGTCSVVDTVGPSRGEGPHGLQAGARRVIGIIDSRGYGVMPLALPRFQAAYFTWVVPGGATSGSARLVSALDPQQGGSVLPDRGALSAERPVSRGTKLCNTDQPRRHHCNRSSPTNGGP